MDLKVRQTEYFVQDKHSILRLEVYLGLRNPQNLAYPFALLGTMSQTKDANIQHLRKELKELAEISRMKDLGPLAKVAVHDQMLKYAFALKEALQ